MSRKSGWRHAAAAILALGVSLTAAHAESPALSDANYNFLRYDDDFSYLADPSKSNDFWDPIKYIPIATGPYGPSYISMGGELRERFESYLNPNFGIKAPPENAYLLSRFMLNTDIHLTDYVRFFIQLGDFERIGDRGVTSTTDIDHLDLMQGFMDLNVPGLAGDNLTVRAGREELAFGFQRLIAAREGPNVRRDFDGFRVTDHIGGATVDVLAVRPINNSEGVLDDHTNEKQALWGVYSTLPLVPGTKIDLYELNYENDAAKYRGLVGHEQRETFGARLFGGADGFDWNTEAAWQLGTFRNMQIRAHMLAAIGGYTFRNVIWTPRIALETNYASGDASKGNAIGTFNAMYPRLPYFGETSMLVPANIYDIRPVVSFRPNGAVLATFGWDNLWRASSSDGLYGSGMTEYAGTNKVTGMFVGSELSADVRWRIDRHLQLGAIAAEFMSGPAIREAVGKNVSFFVLYATYRF